MTKHISYSEKLKDPRWQRKRLEIFERDKFTCLRCGSKDKTLHVHHGFYRRGLEPWEYPDSTLWTYCDDCHLVVAEHIDTIHRIVAELESPQLERIVGAFSVLFEICQDNYKQGFSDGLKFSKEQKEAAP